MKIKRYFSSDMRNVIRMVREEAGPDVRLHSPVSQSGLIARRSRQSLQKESLELAFSRVMSNAYV